MKYLLTIFLVLTASSAFSEDARIKFGAGNETYEVIIQNDRVVGGFSQGSKKFEVWGGAKLGDRMHVIFRRNDGDNGEYAWWSHDYRISNDTVILETSVAKSGKVITNRNAKYRIYDYVRH